MRYFTDKMSLYLLSDVIDEAAEVVEAVMLDTLMDCNKELIGHTLKLRRDLLRKYGSEYDPANPIMIFKHVTPCKCAECGKELGIGRYYLKGTDGNKYCSSACLIKHFSSLEVVREDDMNSEVITVPMFNLTSNENI